jgi:hypothetical protein
LKDKATPATSTIRPSVDSEVGWQRNYYEHVMRDGESSDRNRQDIQNNPGTWECDWESGRNQPGTGKRLAHRHKSFRRWQKHQSTTEVNDGQFLGKYYRR